MSSAGTTAAGKAPARMELEPVPGFELHARYYAARTGGDFFDAMHVGTRVAFLLSDVAGSRALAHPIAAAAQEAFRKSAPQLYGGDTNVMEATALLVQEVNHALIGASTGTHFAPTFVGCYDRDLGVLAYVNAGGLTAVIRDSDGTRELGNVAMPMGLFTHLTYEPAMQAFEPGARLLVVTKGVIECQRGRSLFGAERVRKLVEGANGASATELCERTLAAAHDFEQVSWFGRHRPGNKKKRMDDLTAMVVVRP